MEEESKTKFSMNVEFSFAFKIYIISSQNTVDNQSKVRYYMCRNQFNFILFIILECLNDGSHIFHNGGDTKVFPKY